ncbi:MAG: carboxypeptidase regulatory-like domain-containing protein [Gemmatimonadota bacterium]
MSKASSSAGMLVAFLLALGGCGGGGEGRAATEQASGSEAASEEPGTNEASTPEEGGYRTIEVANGGTIQGTVRFDGPAPVPEQVEVTEDAATCGEFKQVAPLRIGSRGGLADAVVSLTDIREGAPLPEAAPPPELDQRSCSFSPHVLVAPAGSPVRILNSDPIMHNVHTLSFDNRPINRSQPAGVRQIEVTFDRPEKVKARCDVHGWMSAWIVVTDHPYQAVTGPDGSFRLENVPPGTYTLEIWHEALGSSTRSVSVEPGGVTEADAVLTEASS